MLQVANHLLTLLRVALGTSSQFETPLDEEEWEGVYDEARRHCVLGIALEGIERLPGYQRPSQERMAYWILSAQRLEERNKHVNECCKRLTDKFRTDGYSCWVLKGQSAANYYPNPRRRNAGDIDIWVMPKDRTLGLKASRQVLVDMVRRVTGLHDEVTYHHTDFRVFDDVCVELHFTPSWMFAPWHNRRLQRWYRNYAEQMAQPTTDAGFDVVFMLTHLYRHVFDGGVGLRQIIDYYYVLMSMDAVPKDAEHLLKSLGHYRFASGLMWMMGEALGLSRDKMIVAPNERAGRWLLTDIMLAGNFGHEDLRGISVPKGRWMKLVWRMRQNVRRTMMFPSEGLCEMPWRVIHLLWRWKNGYL